MAPKPGNTQQEEFIKGKSGLNIFVRSWRPGENRAGPSSSYTDSTLTVASTGGSLKKLVATGLAVYALDHRGRGKSDSKRFYVEKMTDYVGDWWH
jgi:acylglycerol lipase